MKNLLLTLLLTALCAAGAFAARNFVEGTDFFADFTRNEEGRAALLHINFTDLMPSPEEAETLVKEQLKIYAKVIEADAKAAKKEKSGIEKKRFKTRKKIEEIKDPQELRAFFDQEDAKEEKYINIIGSVWYGGGENAEDRTKIQYSEDSSAFVFIGKTKKIVPFPEYVKFLKKEKDGRKQKEKERTQMIRQLLRQELKESGEAAQEPQS